jgi:hypothetical protein
MKAEIISLTLCLAVAGCGATCQPIYTPVRLEEVPPEVLQSISAAFPGAKLDRAEEISSMVGPGYRVSFHDGRWNYSIQFLERGAGKK